MHGRILTLICVVLGCGCPAAGQDAGAGKILFEGRGGCLTCHTLDDRGGALGPELSEVSIRRSPESLRLALVDPDAEIYEEYFTTVVKTKSGQTIEGLALNEDDLSIQLRDRNGNLKSFLKDAVKSVQREERSLMPSYASRLSKAEIEDLVAYLRTLRGKAPSRTGSVRVRPQSVKTPDIPFLERPERDEDERPESLMNALQIPLGAIVADLGSANGYFTWRMAQRVGPRGRVLAVDVQQQMLDLTAETVAKHKAGNVEFILGTESDPKLPVESLDLVLIANRYHGFPQPEAIMIAIYKSLKPGGRLVILEFAKESKFATVSSDEKMSLSEMRSEIEPLGFQLERVLDFLPVQHGLIFSKRP